MTTNDGCRADVRKARAEAARVDTSLTEAEWTRLRHAAGNRGDLGPIAEEFDRILAERLATDTAAPEGAFFVSAGVEAALTEAARTGRDINIAGALYRKVNHGPPAAPVAVEGVETVAAVRVGFRYQDGEVLSPEREATSEDVELPVAVLDLGDGEWLTLGEIRDLRVSEWSPVEPETSEPEGGGSRG